MPDVGPYPVPPGIDTLLVFGGTFDPPHRAHVALPLAARDAIGADWLLYVPAGRSPHKRSNPVASDTDRLDLLAAALGDEPRVSISTIECPDDASEKSPAPTPVAPSYTVDTLERLSTLAGGTRLRLLIGADQAASFHRWREPGRIIAMAEPLVMLRNPHDSRDELLAEIGRHWPASEAEAWAGRIVEVPLMDISATRVRALLHAGAFTDPHLASALGPGVIQLIRDRGLYAGG